MKNIKYIFILIAIGLSVVSCEEKLLDKEPLDIISDAVVWNDESLLNAYVANLYGRMKIPTTFLPALTATELAGDEMFISDEATTPHVWHSEWIGGYIFGNLTSSGGFKEYWDYELIRDCNTFIENIGAEISEDTKTELTAEVRMIRAYTYFEMVKRYGGIPLITKAQSIDDSESELYVARDTEQDVYDLIASEIDAVLDDLPSDDKNRFTKYGALALKSRAMLYAGSIARYGTVQLDGIVGISSDLADDYFQASYNASIQIIPESDGGSGESAFSLYEDDITEDDLSSYSDNYYNLFITEQTSESIFEVDFISGIRSNIASSYGTNCYGTMMFPCVEFANAFEMVDGSSGVIDYANIAVDYVPDLYKNKDPRFNASILNEGDTWHDTETHCNYWIIKENGDKLSERGVYYTGQNGVTMPQKGDAETTTGFSTKKMVKDYTEAPLQGSVGTDDVPCMVFRLGEMYLNCAEAAYELGKTDESLKYVNRIRKRAGILQLTSISMEKIKQERRIELSMGEAHRYWDLRRWRDAAKSSEEGGLNGLRITNALVYYDYRDGKFHFEVTNAEDNARVFKEAYYYLPITATRINNNPNLIENPGY